MKRSQVCFFLSLLAHALFFFSLYSLILFLAFLLGCWTSCLSLQPALECFLREFPIRICGEYCHAAGLVVIASHTLLYLPLSTPQPFLINPFRPSLTTFSLSSHHTHFLLIHSSSIPRTWSPMHRVIYSSSFHIYTHVSLSLNLPTPSSRKPPLSLHPNLIAVKLLGACAANANLHHGLIPARACHCLSHHWQLSISSRKRRAHWLMKLVVGPPIKGERNKFQ